MAHKPEWLPEFRATTRGRVVRVENPEVTADPGDSKAVLYIPGDPIMTDLIEAIRIEEEGQFPCA